MSRLMRISRPCVLAALVLAFSGAACNAPGNQSSDSEAIIQGTSVAYEGASMAATTTAFAVDITFSVIPRDQGTKVIAGPLNAVEFVSYTITFTAPAAGVSTGSLLGVFYPVGSSGNVIILGLGAKLGAGTLYAGHIHFDGRDNLGRPVTFDLEFSTVLTL